jgi:basic amino acid/polyamine antiporter, APA family
LLAWVVGGVLAVIGALTFAELGAMMPAVGGQFAVIRAAFGRRMAFLSVASVTMTVQAGAVGILALLCAGNLFRGFGWAGAGRASVTAGALAALGLVYAINVAGVRLSARVLRANVAVKLAAIAAIVAIAAASTQPAPPRSFEVGEWPGFGAFVYALIPTLFSYGGFEQVLWAAGEVRDPKRNVALGILIGVGVVLVAYLATNVSFLALLGPAGVAQDPSLLAARAVDAGAPGLGAFVAFAVAISALGTTHAIMLTAPRQIVALARDGMAPRALGRISPRSGTPIAATSFIAAVSVVLTVAAGLEGLDALLDSVICVNWFFFGITGLSLIELRQKMPDLPRPFRVPGYPATPLFFSLAAFAAAASPFFQDKGRVPAIWAAVLVLTLGIVCRFWIRGPKETE